MLKVNLVDDRMGFTFFFDEAHEDSFLQKTDNQQLISEALTDFTGHYTFTEIYKVPQQALKD